MRVEDMATSRPLKEGMALIPDDFLVVAFMVGGGEVAV